MESEDHLAVSADAKGRVIGHRQDGSVSALAGLFYAPERAPVSLAEIKIALLISRQTRLGHLLKATGR